MQDTRNLLRANEMDIFELYAGVINITTDPSRTSWLCPLLLASDAALSALIVWKIPCQSSFHLRSRPFSEFINNFPPPPSFPLPTRYLLLTRLSDTEIDFSTYMQQVSLFRSGEHDYTKLTGSTGPLVYPAGHVYLYSALHEMTAGGERVLLAQGIFVALYLLGLAVVMAVYRGVKVCGSELLGVGFAGKRAGDAKGKIRGMRRAMAEERARWMSLLTIDFRHLLIFFHS